MSSDKTQLSVSIVGLGKVGSSMAATFASKGYQVIGVDINQAFIKKINRGISPVTETNIESYFRKYHHKISATTNLKDAIAQTDITFIVVPTPSDKNGEFITSFAEEAALQIGKALRNKSTFHLVVLSSTVLPGATEEKILTALENYSGRRVGLNYGFCYSPLFIALGDVINNILNPDTVLIGEFDQQSGDILEKFYKSIIDNEAPITRMNIINAELTKIAVNTYITTKITYANSLAEICEKLPSSNVDIVTKAVGLDSRIGSKYLKAGLGFGGTCFPRDTVAFAAMAKKIGLNANLAIATDITNKDQAKRAVRRLLDSGEQLNTVAVLGITYKTNTPVFEGSQGLEIAQLLVEQNKKVVVFDPMIDHIDKKKLDPKINLAKSVKEAISNSQAIIITLPYEEFKITPSDFAIYQHPVIVDCWRILNPEAFRGKASYYAVGLKEDAIFNFNNLRKQKIVICGAGGFIGGHLVEDLLRQGYINIRAIDIKPLEKWNQKFPNVENLQLDLKDKTNTDIALQGADMVYNLAADMGGMGFIESNRAFCMLNVLINTHLLESAIKYGVKRYFFASSACVYASYRQDRPDIKPLKESDAYPALPEDGYGWEKLFSERMCKNFSEDFNIQTRIARFHNIYGPFSSYEGGREKAPAAICRKVIEAKLSGNLKIEIWGDGNQTRSFTYIDDCVKGIQDIMFSDINEPINLGSSEMVTINQLVDIVEEIAGVKLSREYNLSAPKGVNGRNSDNTLIKSYLDWEPSTRLKDGLKKTYEWIYANMFKDNKSNRNRDNNPTSKKSVLSSKQLVKSIPHTPTII